MSELSPSAAGDDRRVGATAPPAEQSSSGAPDRGEAVNEPTAGLGADDGTEGAGAPARRRRRGSRGGRNRNRSGEAASAVPEQSVADLTSAGPRLAGEPQPPADATGPPPADISGPAPADISGAAPADDSKPAPAPADDGRRAEAARIGRPSAPDQAAEDRSPGSSAGAVAPGPPAPLDRPKIGDTRPAPPPRTPVVSSSTGAAGNSSGSATAARPAPPASRPAPPGPGAPSSGPSDRDGAEGSGKRRRRRGGRGRTAANRSPVEAIVDGGPAPGEPVAARKGRERKGRPVGRYLMAVNVRPHAIQIAVLEGRSLIEHYVSRPADDVNQIDGNIYLGRVQNVLPGMEAAFLDIGTPKNAVLYRGDLRYDEEDVIDSGDGAKPTRGRTSGGRTARIEQLLRPGQSIICQVTKNPIGTKGARLTQEVSLPGRFVVLIPDSDTYGISKRLPEDERKRLRRILDEVRPAGHGLIVRTAAEGATPDELRRDVGRLLDQWKQIENLAARSRPATLLYREPDMAVRVIREEFNRDYRSVVIDDRRLFEEIRDYVASINPELADRVEFAGDSDDPLPIFERFHVHEQVHKALDRKVWLPSGGSLIIERTEALTVIDVNTGKNVGTSNLEETVFRNNLEAAEEIARQLRLRDIGGIIVIDFIDMEVTANRAEVTRVFREALARDKTRTQVFEISELGLVEMTRKRISEGLVESFSETCPTCAGRGIVIDESLL